MDMDPHPQRPRFVFDGCFEAAHFLVCEPLKKCAADGCPQDSAVWSGSLFRGNVLKESHTFFRAERFQASSGASCLTWHRHTSLCLRILESAEPTDVLSRVCHERIGLRVSLLCVALFYPSLSQYMQTEIRDLGKQDCGATAAMEQDERRGCY